MNAHFFDNVAFKEADARESGKKLGTKMEYLQDIIENAYEQRDSITTKTVPEQYKDAILKTIDLLNRGEIRVAKKLQQQWVVNEWVKKAVLLYFCITQKHVSSAGFTEFYDKVPLKY